MTGDPPSHEPPYPGPDANADPRPWWYREDRARQQEFNGEIKEEVRALRRAVSDGFDKVADELAVTRGVATGKKATLSGIVLAITTAAAVVGVLAAILVPLLTR